MEKESAVGNDRIENNDNMVKAQGYIALGLDCCEKGYHDAAEDYFLKARLLGGEIYGQTKAFEAGMTIARAWYLQGRICEKEIFNRDYQGYARDCYIESLNLYQQLDTDGAKEDVKKNIALCCYALGSLYEERNIFNMAAHYYKKGLEMQENIQRGYEI